MMSAIANNVDDYANCVNQLGRNKYPRNKEKSDNEKKSNKEFKS